MFGQQNCFTNAFQNIQNSLNAVIFFFHSIIDGRWVKVFKFSINLYTFFNVSKYCFF